MAGRERLRKGEGEDARRRRTRTRRRRANTHTSFLSSRESATPVDSFSVPLFILHTVREDAIK